MVSVQDIGSGCPEGENRVMPQSETNLVKFGMTREDDLNEEPDWGLIIGQYSSQSFLLSLFNALLGFSFQL